MVRRSPRIAEQCGFDFAQPRGTPFLRWAGGKRQLTKKLMSLIPSDWRGRTYHEPFVGAGNLFFALAPAHARLADANAHLIECYAFVRDSPSLVARYLQQHAALDNHTYYYHIRAKYNRSSPSAAQAARFIYLNKACYNGIFRVNRMGEFNVPYGHQYRTPDFPSSEMLVSASKALARAELRSQSFEESLAAVGRNSFVYLDPPYPPLNGTSRFTEYTVSGFGANQQDALAVSVTYLDKVGCKFMMTNADTEVVRKLYRKWNFIDIQVVRHVSCKAKRHRVAEVVIRNY
jgi:DNA adenine methylase